MNIKKIAAFSGAGVLAIAAVFASRPKSQISTLYWTVAGSCQNRSVAITASTNFTTGTAGETQASIITAAAGSRKFYAVCNPVTHVASVAVHFHP